MRLSADFEDVRDIEAFVRAWAPVFQLGDSMTAPVAITPAQVQVVTDITPPAPAAPPILPQQSVPVQPPVQPVQQPQAPQAPVPTTAVTYSLDDLARAAMTLMDTGRQADLQLMLSRFGVQSLPELPPTQYGAFATELRAMGAQI